VEGVVNSPGTFVVLTPGKGTLAVKVVGPKSEAKVEVKVRGPFLNSSACAEPVIIGLCRRAQTGSMT
jgi:hypothetical protein